MTARVIPFPAIKRIAPRHYTDAEIAAARAVERAFFEAEEAERWARAVSIISGAYSEDDLTPCA